MSLMAKAHTEGLGCALSNGTEPKRLTAESKTRRMSVEPSINVASLLCSTTCCCFAVVEIQLLKIDTPELIHLMQVDRTMAETAADMILLNLCSNFAKVNKLH